jgi:hypothetical protein
VFFRNIQIKEITDETAPTTAATLDPAAPNGDNGWYVSPVEVALDASDEGGSGVTETEYRLDGGQWQLYEGPFTVSKDGQHTVDYRSTAEAGNIEEPKSVSLKIDRTAQAMSCVASPSRLHPPNHMLVRITVDVTLSDATSGPAGYMLTAVTSDEPDAGTSNEDLPNDIQGWDVGTADTSREFCAERADAGTVVSTPSPTQVRMRPATRQPVRRRFGSPRTRSRAVERGGERASDGDHRGGARSRR